MRHFLTVGLLFFSLSCFAEISKITEGIYISDLPSAREKKALRDSRITHIMDLGRGNRDIFSKIPSLPKNDFYTLDDLKEKFVYIDLPTMDRPEFPIEGYFIPVNRTLRKILRNPENKVLVHCDQGISRSVTVVISHLMREGMRLENAIHLVQRKRPVAEPNQGFFAKLLGLDERLQKRVDRLSYSIDQQFPDHGMTENDIRQALAKSNWNPEKGLRSLMELNAANMLVELGVMEALQ